MLASYSLLAMTSQLVWLSFAPIATRAAPALGVSAGAVGDLAAINPLMYALVALPAGRWMDRRFNASLTAGALLTMAGALVRCAWPTSFACILTGQFLSAVGQPLVLNATTKLAVRYFPPSERTMAISVGSVAQFAGILVASTTGEGIFQVGGLRALLLIHALVAVAAATSVLASLRVLPGAPNVPGVTSSLRWLLRDRVTWQLAGLLFIGVGVFNALATWLDPVLHSLGHGGAAGPLITVITVGGILGAAVLPQVAAARERRRRLLIVAIVFTTLVFSALATVHDLAFIGVALFLEGFVLLACLPVALEWSELHVGADRAGTAAGFLLSVGNLGGAVLVLVLQPLIDSPRIAFFALALMALPGLALAAQLPAGAHPRPTARMTDPDRMGDSQL
jgi:predicted MFS family arabinose efflux permease